MGALSDWRPARRWLVVGQLSKRLRLDNPGAAARGLPRSWLRCRQSSRSRRGVCHASQHRGSYARPGERLLRQLDLVARQTRIRALEGNHWLHHKCEHFDDRRKMSVMANTAIARELAGWCWSLAAPIQQGERMNAA